MSSVPPWLVASAGAVAGSSAAGSRSLFDIDSCKEYDRTEREATLWLFTRAVDDSLPDDVMYHHWALVFHFEDGNDFRTVEGFSDSENKLFGSYTKECPRQEGKFYDVGKVIISPSKVLTMAKANPYNQGTYLATWQNCQTWVKAFGEMLGEEIYRKIRNYKTLKEGNPVVAAVGKSLGNFSRLAQALSEGLAAPRPNHCLPETAQPGGTQ